MSICGKWSVVNDSGDIRIARRLYCRCWSCERCQPRRQAQLIAAGLTGRPNSLLTLTVRPTVEGDRHTRAVALAHAWRRLRRHLSETLGYGNIPFLAVFEATERGEPHLHILLRAPFIPQRIISEFMDYVLGSPIVDIRRIDNTYKAVQYVCKYIGKAPEQFEHTKRYWSSRDWQLPAEGEAGYEPPKPGEWHVVRNSLDEIEQLWSRDADCVYDGDDVLIAMVRGSPGPAPG